jgi:hypothetical protein
MIYNIILFLLFPTFLQGLPSNSTQCSSAEPCSDYGNFTTIELGNNILTYNLPANCPSADTWLWPDGTNAGFVDWSDATKNPCSRNIAGPVRDQANCGSCYAFAAVGSIQSQYAINNNLDFNLAPPDPRAGIEISVQQAISCTYRRVQFTAGGKIYNNGCGSKFSPPPPEGSGITYLTNPFPVLYYYATNAYGICADSTYPYVSGKNSIFPFFFPKLPDCQTTCSSITTIRNVNVIRHTNTVAGRINVFNALKNGPIITGINFQADVAYAGSATITSPCKNDANENTNHAILIVGYGKINTFDPDHNYWKLKDSHGTTIGSNGYFYIKDYPSDLIPNGICNIMKPPMFQVVL